MSLAYAPILAARADAEAPLYGRTADGYGRKIPTRYWVKLDGDTRERRVYCIIFSNVGSLFVVRHGERVWLSDTELEVALGR